jgi:hypothetical protein
MAAKPVVDGIEKQLGQKRLRLVRVDVGTKEGRRIASRVELDLVPTIIGYDGGGVERWRFTRVPKRQELWARIVAL